MGQVVGFDITKTKQEIMYTANNEPMVTFAGKIEIRIDGEERSLPCVFTDRDDTPFLLGRAGFFDIYEINLSAKKKTMTVIG